MNNRAAQKIEDLTAKVTRRGKPHIQPSCAWGDVFYVWQPAAPVAHLALSTMMIDGKPYAEHIPRLAYSLPEAFEMAKAMRA